MNNKLVAVFAICFLVSMPQAFADDVLLENFEIVWDGTEWFTGSHTLDVDMNAGDSLVFDYAVSSGSTTNSGKIYIDGLWKVHVYYEQSGVYTYTAKSSGVVNVEIKYSVSTVSGGSNSFTINSLTHIPFDVIEEPIVCDAGFELVGDTCELIEEIDETEFSTLEDILLKISISDLGHFLHTIKSIDGMSHIEVAQYIITMLSDADEAELVGYTEKISIYTAGNELTISSYSNETLKNYLTTVLTDTEIDAIPENQIPVYAALFLDQESGTVKNILDSLVEAESACELPEVYDIETDSCIIPTDPVIDEGTDETIEEEPKKSGGGSGEWKTKPTFGLSHQTWMPLVDGGFTFNGIVYEITDNWHTDFPIQNVTLGELNTFEAKVYAQNKLKVQEFLFGIPEVGESHNAELRVEIWYDYDGLVEEIVIVQEIDIVDVSTVNVTHSMVKCQYTDTRENCHSTILTMKFLEPLKDDIMAIYAVDYQRRGNITFLNEGFNISGISLNPMITLFIAGPEKHEGAVEITQTAKYSDLWTTQDGREFEMNNYGSFKLINQVFERYIDTGEPKIRAHSAFAAQIIQQQEIAQQTINEKYGAIESISRDNIITQSKLIISDIESPRNLDELSTICTALQQDYDARILLQTNYSYMADNNLFADTLLDSFPLIQLQSVIDICNDKLDVMES